jgi:hypothetical protein
MSSPEATGRTGAEVPPGQPGEPGPQPAASVPAAARALAQEKVYGEALEKLRARSDLTAKAIAGLGSTAIGGLGIATLTDIWPPGEPGLAIVGLVAGFFAMAAGVILLAQRVWRAQQPVVIGSGKTIDGASPPEQRIADRVSDEIAHFHDVESMRAYEARGVRFERVAARLKGTEPELADRVLKASQVVLAEVSEARMRTVYAIVRRRAFNAFQSLAAVALALLIAVGFYLVGISADKLDAERSGQIQFAKDCATALGTPNIDTSDLPSDCREGAPANPQSTAPASDSGK